MNFFIGFFLGAFFFGWVLSSIDKDIAVKHGAARWILVSPKDNETKFKWNDELDKDTPH